MVQFFGPPCTYAYRRESFVIIVADIQTDNNKQKCLVLSLTMQSWNADYTRRNIKMAKFSSSVKILLHNSNAA